MSQQKLPSVKVTAPPPIRWPGKVAAAQQKPTPPIAAQQKPAPQMPAVNLPAPPPVHWPAGAPSGRPVPIQAKKPAAVPPPPTAWPGRPATIQRHSAPQSASAVTPARPPAHHGTGIIQRAINTTLSVNNLSALAMGLRYRSGAATSSGSIAALHGKAQLLNRMVGAFDGLPGTASAKQRKMWLRRINAQLTDLQSQVDGLIPSLTARDGQDAADAKAYSILVGMQTELTQVSRAANRETATFFNIARAGAGGRPDANKEEGIDRSAPTGMGLSPTEKTFFDTFVAQQGGGWKEKREALSGIWAKRLGMFNNLTVGKVATDSIDVEYRTTDVGHKYKLWDQKTIFTDATAFDGRIAHTHKKVLDSNSKPAIGLLFDSTFENPTNYEKAWLSINQAILTGEIAPGAVREVRAPNPAAYSAGIYVDMATKYDGSGVEANVKWAEGKCAGRQSGGLEVINATSLNGTNYAAVQNGTAHSHSRYTNNRDWLPPGVYDEYAATGLPNPGKGRFVAKADLSAIYLTVTHYSGFTVKTTAGPTVNRNPFYKVE